MSSRLHSIILNVTNIPKLADSFAIDKKIKLTVGKRNYSAIVKASLCEFKYERNNLIHNVKNGKKVTKKLMSESLEMYIEEVKNPRQAFHNARIRYLSNCGRYSTIHKRISNNVGGIERIENARFERIENVFNRLLPSTSGSQYFNLTLTNDPAKINYTSRTEKSNETYSKRCTWRKLDIFINAVLPNNWYSRVHKQGLTNIGGMITLDSSTPLRADISNNDTLHSVKVFAATWLKQSRGTTFNIISGFIAVGVNHNNVMFNFHGKTLKLAIAGLEKKANIQQNLFTGKNHTLLNKAKKCDYPVTINDSYGVGNCVSGTLSFCHRHGISTNSDQSIPLSELAMYAAKEPRNEVFILIASILRKNKETALNA